MNNLYDDQVVVLFRKVGQPNPNPKTRKIQCKAPQKFYNSNSPFEFEFYYFFINSKPKSPNRVNIARRNKRKEICEGGKYPSENAIVRPNKQFSAFH